MNNVFLGYPNQNIIEEITKRYEVDTDPLYFIANEPNATVQLIGWDDDKEEQCDIFCHLQYSTDNKTTWSTYTGQIVYLDSCNNKKVYFRADPENPNVNGFALKTDDIYKYHMFVINNSVAASGNIQYLLQADGKRIDVPSRCYINMFSECSTLTQAPQLPATIVSNGCYANMFYGCEALLDAPALPASSLTEANYCYQNMFYGCSALSSTQCLSAKNLCFACYSGMFRDCTTLSVAPTLPATTLFNSCYQFMFQGCTSLANAPELPATTLANGCYANIFKNCPKFNDCHMKASVQSIYVQNTHGNTTKNIIFDL